MNFTKNELAAILDNLMSRRNCPNGCDCIFCRTFEDGVKSGKREAAIEFANALDELKRSVA